MKIRVATTKDAAQILKIYKPYVETTAISFEYEVPDLEEFSGRIANTLKKYPYLVAEENGQILGYAYAGPFKTRAAYDWAVETSIYVAMDRKRKGIGKALYEELEATLRQMGILNVNACIAYTDSEDEHLNNNSVYFHEKQGYTMVGKFHNCGYKFHHWYHMVWMEKMIGEHVVPQKAVTWHPQRT